MTIRNWNTVATATEQLMLTPLVLPRQLRVLVVDDDVDTTDSLTMILRLWGHDVRSAYNGETALRLAANERPDVVLLDVAMPTMTGYEVAHRIHRSRSFRQTRLIAVSGYAEDAHQSRCREAGFDDFLAKPLDLVKLKSLLLVERDRLPRPIEWAPCDPAAVGAFERDLRVPTGRDDGLLIHPHRSVEPSAG